MTLPCIECITRAICKYKPLIDCNLLVNTFDTLKLDFLIAERRLETILSILFGWRYKFTLVQKIERPSHSTTIIISDYRKPRIDR